MKGVVFNLLEEFITQNFGAQTYEEIMARCPLHTKDPFIGPGTYPDADLIAIVGKTCEKLGVTVPEALHRFGKFSFPHLAAKVPSFLNGHTHPKTFLKTIDAVIHVEVRKLFKGAVTPKIGFIEEGDTFTMTYQSERKVCAFFAGLVEGAGHHFDQPIAWTETACMLEGAPACTFDLKFGTAAKRSAA